MHPPHCAASFIRPLDAQSGAPLLPSVGSRVKILGGLNIAEKRLPQDGRIQLKIAGRDYDVRLSTVPVAHGERLDFLARFDAEFFPDILRNDDLPFRGDGDD